MKSPKPLPVKQAYVLPPLDLLEPTLPERHCIVDDLKAQAKILQDTMREFGIKVESGDISKGPTVTLFEFHSAPGVRVKKIAALSSNLAMAVRVKKIRVLAPIPGKGTVGIEVPNIARTNVRLRDMLESNEWRLHNEGIPVALGCDILNHPIIGDLTQMPHLLIAGRAESGTTSCVNALIASLLYKFAPQDLRLILIDPKIVEMQHYKTLPHLLAPIITKPKKVPLALGWVIHEMEKRFQLFAKTGVRNIRSFNARPNEKVAPDKTKTDNLESRAPQGYEVGIPEKLPFIVVIVNELAAFMERGVGKDVEIGLARVTQLGRAAGIHMVVATQHPSIDVVTGVIKANIPSRIAFQVASLQDSRVILDSPGAEKLFGEGDMLYEPGSGRVVRAQGVLVPDNEIKRIVDFINAKAATKFDPELEQSLKRSSTTLATADDIDEELLNQCIEVIRQSNRASVSILQRRLRIGYTRATKIMAVLEERGIVGPSRGAEPREILDEELREHCIDIINPPKAAAINEDGGGATYIALLQFTEQGTRNIKATTARAIAMNEMAAGLGITVVNVYWTLGPYDVVMELKVPDDQTLTAFTLKLRSLGNVTIQTMRAFGTNEIDSILGKI